MTDYNDGKWHGWTGGKCPVHPDTVLIVKWSCNGEQTVPLKASQIKHWEGDEVCAFRVTKPFRKPLELWVNVYEDKGSYSTYFSLGEAKNYLCANGRTVHMREVANG